MPMYCAESSDYPVAEYLAARGINLPSWPTMNTQQQDLVIESIRRYFQG